MEVQDPVHRQSWAPVNLELSNYFRDYDFNHVVPCPMTRQKAIEDSAYLKPRAQHPRDFSIFLMSEKEVRLRLNTPVKTTNKQTEAGEVTTDGDEKKEATKKKKRPKNSRKHKR